MLTALMVLLRSFRLICGGHRGTALENLARRRNQAREQRPTASSPPDFMRCCVDENLND